MAAPVPAAAPGLGGRELITLRATVSTDLPAIKQLLNVVWDGDEGALAYHGGGRVPGVVALKGGQIIGYASAQRKTLHTRHTYVGVHVRPGGRGQGWGRRCGSRSRPS